jgi:hypothetical protein
MSEMAPEGGAGGGSLFSKKVMGIPVFLLVIGAAAIVGYLYFKNKSGSQSAGSPSTSGGGGTITSGNTTIDKGAVQVTVTQTPPTSTSTSTSTQPTPPAPAKTSSPVVYGGDLKNTQSISAPGNLDLKNIAAEYGISEQQLVSLNQASVGKYVGTGKAIPKGTSLKIPSTAKKS